MRSKSSGMLYLPLAAICLCLVIVSCGGDSQQETPTGSRQSDSAKYLAARRAHRLVPKKADFGTYATAEEGPLALPIRSVCNLKEIFWEVAAGQAVSPLIRKGRETYLVLVGVFEVEGGATRAYARLIKPSQQQCYINFVRRGYTSQFGPTPVTRPHVVALRGSSSLALEVETKLHLPSRDYNSDARLGVLRRSNVIYLIANFRWGHRSLNPITVFDRIVRSRIASLRHL